MSWNHCSETGEKLLVGLLVVALAGGTALAALAGPAAAAHEEGDGVTIETDNMPNRTQVGDDVGLRKDVRFVLSNLYADQPDRWTLRADTELVDRPVWRVELRDTRGNQIGESYQVTGQNLTIDLGETEETVQTVELQLEGTVPEVDAYSYEPPQNYTIAQFSNNESGSVIHAYRVAHYTTSSNQARLAIRNASRQIQDARSVGADVSEAEELLSSAKSVYADGNFQEAINIAGNARDQAGSALASKQQSSLLIQVGAGIVAVVVVVGIAYWAFQRRDSGDKLG